MENTNDVSYVIRLLPGNDLRLSLEHFANEYNIEAGWMITCVGSLTAYSIRFANQRSPSNSKGYFEIVQLSGTVSINGCHLHITVADEKGQTIGGHLLHGCTVYTTAEIVMVKSASYIFTREKCNASAWKELQIKSK